MVSLNRRLESTDPMNSLLSILTQINIPGVSAAADNAADTASNAAPADTTVVGQALEHLSAAKTPEETVESVKSLISPDTFDFIISSLVNFAFKLAIAIVVALLGKFVIKWLFNWAKRILTHRNTDPSLVTFLLSFIKITLYFILIVIVVGILGVETSSLIAIFASAGVAIGMALSGTLQNFAGGVLILLLKPYKVGDFIEAQGYTGTVKEIQIFSTIINTPDNKTIIIPNGGLSTGSINNYSREKRRRVDWTIGIAYGTSYETAREKILELLRADDRVEADPAPFVAINELADSSVNLAVHAWVGTADYWPVYFEMNEKFYRVLPEAGVDFPFPQLDVHLTKS